MTAVKTSGASMTISGRPWDGRKKKNGKVNRKKVYPIPGHEHGGVIHIREVTHRDTAYSAEAL